MHPLRRISRVGALVLVIMALATACLEVDVRYLAGDATNGRNNGTAGAALARNHVLTYLNSWTSGANSEALGLDAFKQEFTGGTNLLGVIPGTDLADEYVLVGAHLDGLGNSCRNTGPADSICNGATDNATGAAVVIDIMRQIALSPEPPRRSVIFAFWDREEDGLLGSQAYVNDPLIPLEDTVAYVNMDIQGANLRPSSRDVTFAIGAETGGTLLSDATAAAAAPGPLDTRLLSVVFGQGRSDHAVLIAAGVPSVFFTDSTGPCYHTVDDESEIVDFGKLAAQAGTAHRHVLDLASRDDTPTLAAGLPLATFSDAESVQELLHLLLLDLDTFSAADQTAIHGHVATVDGIVANGEGAFDNTSLVNLLLAAQAVVGILDNGPCDGFLAPPP
jgi:Zn-dependent M28 family amino/carboxypeptidase